MKVIIGLGNAGLKYKNTRHNIGFEVIDKIIKQYPKFKKKRKFCAYLYCGEISSQKVILVKPLTFVNQSGSAVSQIVNFFKIPLSDILVVCDDFNIDIGKIKFKQKGTFGGHNGLQSIIDALGTNNFPRCRIGIKSQVFLEYKEKNLDIADFVLSCFSQEEREIINMTMSFVVEGIISFIEKGIVWTMNKYNASRKI